MHGNQVFQRVRNALAQVESEQNVRVLFACESGSRAARPPTNLTIPLRRLGGASPRAIATTTSAASTFTSAAGISRSRTVAT